MSDLVERLRVDGFPYQSIKREAADRIEQLEADVNELTEQLHALADNYGDKDDEPL